MRARVRVWKGGEKAGEARRRCPLSRLMERARSLAPPLSFSLLFPGPVFPGPAPALTPGVGGWH